MYRRLQETKWEIYRRLQETKWEIYRRLRETKWVRYRRLKREKNCKTPQEHPFSSEKGLKGTIVYHTCKYLPS